MWLLLHRSVKCNIYDFATDLDSEISLKCGV